MKSPKTLLYVAALTAPLLSGAAFASDDECEALFVHSADQIVLDGSSITMKGVSPNVIFFCDRPVRFAGHMTVEGFLGEVSGSDDPFSTNPPNAVVSIVADDGKTVDVVVTVTARPNVDGTTITYPQYTVLQGEAQTATGPGSIFIDHFGHPMSPGSVGGVHRRHERRAVRSCDAADKNDNGVDCSCGPGLVCYWQDNAAPFQKGTHKTEMAGFAPVTA